MINVKDYGAIGDGIANDYKPFYYALEALSNGGTLYIPAGKYLWNSLLDINKPVKFVGETGTEILNGGSFILANSNRVSFDTIIFTGTSSFCSLCITNRKHKNDEKKHGGWFWYNCVFNNTALLLEACVRKRPNGTETEYGSDVVEDVLIDNCIFNTASIDRMLSMANTHNVCIRNCHIQNGQANATGIKVCSGSYDTKIDGCIVENMVRDGIDMFDSRKTTVINTVFRNCKSLGCEVKWGSPNDGNTVEEHMVIGCRFDNCLIGCSMSTPYGIVSNSLATNCNVGIRTLNSAKWYQDPQDPYFTDSVVFNGNITRNCNHGLWLGGRRMSVTGNVVSGASRYGIVVYGRELVIANNVLYNNRKDYYVHANVQDTLTMLGNRPEFE